MYLLENTGRSPRGVHDVNGRCVVVEPKEKKPVKITKETAEMLVRMGTFSVTSVEQAPQQQAATEDQQEPEDLTQLRKDAEELGIEVDGRWGAKRLQSEIDNALRNTDSDAVQG